MLSRRVIPCLDVRGGRVVKGVRFQGLLDAGDPADLAERYEQEGADELALLDISATPEGRATALETVAKVRQRLSIPLCVGGGVRSPDDAARLLDAGADKVAINSAAVSNPALIAACADRLGTQCVVIAIDAARKEIGMASWEVVVRSGAERTGIDAVEWAERSEGRGAGEVLLTSWDRDGTKIGFDIELIRAVTPRVRVPVIASGGASRVEDFRDAIRAGAEAVLAASVFHYGELSVEEVKRYLRAQGEEVRR